jgi:hypothetical protein
LRIKKSRSSGIVSRFEALLGFEFWFVWIDKNDLFAAAYLLYVSAFFPSFERT